LIRAALVLALCSALPALAQLPPVDAGSQLRDAEKKAPALPRKPPPRLEVEPPARPPLAPPPGTRFMLRDVRFTGNTAYSAGYLKWVLHGLIGREVGLAQLEEITARITRFYREQGYMVARAYLPQQEIRDGVVEIAILEGRLGRLDLQNDSRVRTSMIEGYFEPLTGQAIREDGLERKLLLLSDLPGIGGAGAALRPGDQVGESALGLGLSGTRALGTTLELDNYGSYYTGEWRVSAGFELASPTGYGDLLGARFTKGMPGLDLVQLGYQLPLGRDGLRAGVNYSGLRYELGKDFAALDAHGRAQSAGATLTYPWVRQRTVNVNVAGGVTHRELDDRIDVTETVVERSTNVGALSLSGDWRDALGGGAVSVWSLTYSGGKLEIETPAALTADQAALRTEGSFQKVNWNFVRAQRIEDRWSALLSFSGQYADKNLDSSEKFALGGPFGVRGFPLGEASGDQGLLASAELRFDITPAVLQASAFVDLGQVKLSHDPLPGSGENDRELWSAGAGVNWTAQRGWSARAMLAWANEPSSAAPERKPRGWLQLAWRI
jgi:hemolysin activation/secretion protein